MARNGKDDDRNGYVDDINGWNFLGLPDSSTLTFLPKEETRLYARLRPLYAADETNRVVKPSVPPAQQQGLAQWRIVKPYFESRQANYKRWYELDSRILAQDSATIARMKQAFGVSRIDTALLHHPPTSDSSLLQQAQAFYQGMLLRGYADGDLDS